MRSVVLRSVCCGVAAAVVSAEVYVLAVFWYGVLKTPTIPRDPTGTGGEVGWDLITMSRNAGVFSSVWFVGAFAIGFWFGYRYFAKRSCPQTI